MAATDRPDVHDATLEVFRRARAAQAVASAEVLARPGEPGAVAESLVVEAWGRVDALAAASPAKPQYACGAGCSWCCHQPILIAAPEAIAIAQVLREAYLGEALVRVAEVLAARARQVGPAGWDQQWLRQHWACAFLAPDGRCGIHAWRPVVCRGYHSLSRQACEDWMKGVGTTIPVDRASHLAGNGVLHGLIEATRAAGRGRRLYELHGSVLFALSDAGVATRWAGGGDPFPGLWSTEPGELS